AASLERQHARNTAGDAVVDVGHGALRDDVATEGRYRCRYLALFLRAIAHHDDLVEVADRWLQLHIDAAAPGNGLLGGVKPNVSEHQRGVTVGNINAVVAARIRGSCHGRALHGYRYILQAIALAIRYPAGNFAL